MHIVLFILIQLLGVASTALADDRDLEDLQQANALLQAEFDLARSGEFYLLIDMQVNQLQLKASGQALQSWRVDRYRRWGHPSALPASRLGIKSVFDKPERNVQVVNMAEPSVQAVSKSFKARELTDMPSTYKMELVNGTTISVRSTPVAWFGHIRGVLEVSAWYLSRPLISNWSFLSSSPYNELALCMSAQDARMLYWAFNEGTPCLIRLPAEVSPKAPTPIGKNR